MPSPHETGDKPIDPRLVLGPNTTDLLGVSELSMIEVITPWYRGGSESYVSEFLLDKDGVKRHLIAKACVKFGPREAMAEWLSRRYVLQEAGVQTPELVVVDGATIVEEFIPYSFSAAYSSASLSDKMKLREAFFDTYQRISMAGFAPTTMYDLRTRGEDAVVIDFGEDLGPSHAATTSGLDITANAERCFRTLAAR
jgi:hypothetical protein